MAERSYVVGGIGNTVGDGLAILDGVCSAEYGQGLAGSSLVHDQAKVVGGDCVTEDVRGLKCSESKLPPDETMKLWRLARREVSKKG